jgi:hypothetical protein
MKYDYRITELAEAIEDFKKYDKNKTEPTFIDGKKVHFDVDLAWIYNSDHVGDKIELTFKNKTQVEKIFGKKLDKIVNMDLINFYEHHFGSDYHLDCVEYYPHFLKMDLDTRIEHTDEVTKAKFDFSSFEVPKKFKIYEYLDSLFN